MAGANDMLVVARRSLGWSEPNAIHKWYSDRNGAAFAPGSTPWCDMSITYWAYHSGNHAAVCPQGDRAYTVWHAQDFQRLGRWHSGTEASVRAAKPGDIVFIDWGGSDSIGAIDHVGVVEKNLGDGRVQTIEGNTDNRCLRRVRAADVIAGYGRPAYGSNDSEEGLDMDAKQVYDAVWERDAVPAPPDGPSGPNWRARSYLTNTYREVGTALTKLDQILAAVSTLPGTDVDEDAIVSGVLAGLTPEAIAAAIPDELAEQVVDALASRLTNESPEG